MPDFSRRSSGEPEMSRKGWSDCIGPAAIAVMSGSPDVRTLQTARLTVSSPIVVISERDETAHRLDGPM